MIVHEDSTTRTILREQLLLAGLDAVEFTDPMMACSAFDAEGADWLITQVIAGPNRLHGRALAAMARWTCPMLRVLFVDRPAYEPMIAGEGEFLPWPFEPHVAGSVVRCWLGAAATAQAPEADYDGACDLPLG